MAQRAHVPEFGNWDGEDNVPYTLFFDKARKGRGGKMINPNDPQENPDMFSNIPSSDPAPAPPSGTKAQAEEPMGRGAARITHDQRRASREDGNNRQFAESPAHNDNMSRRTSGDQSSHQHYGHGSNPGRPSRQSAGSEHSIEKSPLHPHHQAKVRGGGSGSPAWEGKNSYESSHGTPGRSRMKPVTRVEESPDRGAAVPRFGEWENDPDSADNYTHIFNQVREERHTSSSNAPGTKSDSPYYNKQKHNAVNDPKGCCFPFLRK